MQRRSPAILNPSGLHRSLSASPHPFDDAQPERKPPALRACVALLRQCRSCARLRQIHARALRAGVPLADPDLAKHLVFAVLSLPSHLSAARYAHLVFSAVPRPNVFTCNTVIRGHAESADPRPALSVHRRMLALAVPPDDHTYPFLLKACAKLLAFREGERVHARSIKDGLSTSVFTQNTLVHFYAACGLFESAHKLFERMPERNLVTWNSVVNGFAINGQPNEALTLFREMVTEEESDVKPDEFTMVSLLCASAELGALALGRRAHVYLVKKGLGNPHVMNALIDLYAKCGRIDEAHRVFSEMGCGRNAVSWTSLIVGLAVNGFGSEALKLFAGMEREKLVPSEITLVGVLYACSHCGLVDMGFKYFDRMREEYGIVPKIEHYGCMVDLLGRAGLVEEAHNYIMTMPMKPNAVVWRTLLGACAMNKRLELGEAAWARLVELDPGHSGDYVLLSNLYASVGQWGAVHKLRRSMLKGGVRKMPGHSLVELGNRVHEFVMGDRSHPHSDEIYKMLEEIASKLRLEGYSPRTTNVLADIEEEEKETALNYHSERLAIAFALLNTAAGIPIRIVKNLRVCADCHLATKLISKVYGREIIVRDRSRFHHFRDGTCSCKDYCAVLLRLLSLSLSLSLVRAEKNGRTGVFGEHGTGAQVPHLLKPPQIGRLTSLQSCLLQFVHFGVDQVCVGLSSVQGSISSERGACSSSHGQPCKHLQEHGVVLRSQHPYHLSDTASKRIRWND